MEGLTVLLQSFSDLVAPFFNFLVWAFPIKIYRLHDGELGIITTMGKVRRKKAEVTPGVIIVFAFEEVDIIQALGGFINFDEQAIRTKDNRVMLMNGAVEYEVINAKKSILEIEDGALEDLIGAVSLNEMREYARTKNLEEILDSSRLTSGLEHRVNKVILKHGARVENFMITDLRPHEVTMICDKASELLIQYKELKEGI